MISSSVSTTMRMTLRQRMSAASTTAVTPSLGLPLLRRPFTCSSALSTTKPAATPPNNADDSPGEARGGADTEQTGGDADSQDDIAGSDAAFDSSTPKPQDSASQIESETGNDMSRSAANSTPSELASGQKQKKK